MVRREGGREGWVWLHARTALCLLLAAPGCPRPARSAAPAPCCPAGAPGPPPTFCWVATKKKGLAGWKSTRTTRPRFLRNGFWLTPLLSWCTSTACEREAGGQGRWRWHQGAAGSGAAGICSAAQAEKQNQNATSPGGLQGDSNGPPHPAGGLHRHLRVACGSCGCKVVTARVPGDVLDGKLVEHYRAALLAAALPSLPADQLPLLYAAAAGAAAGCARRQRLLSGRLLLFMPRPRGQQEQPLARGSCSAERWRMQACRLAAAGQAAALPSAAASALHMLLHQCQAPAKQRLPAAAGLWEKQVFGLGNPRGSRKTHLPAAAAAARGTTPRS